MGLAERFDRDITLADGRSLHLRPVRPSDRQGLHHLHEHDLSDTSAYYRFFGIRPHLTDEFLDHMIDFEPATRASVVGLRGERIVGVGSYDARAPGTAEVAFAVADDFQGLGVGTVLLEDLAVIARSAGFTQFVAHTMGGNRAMLRVFSQVGLRTRHRLDDGVVDLEIDLADEAGLRARADQREWSAQAASMRPYLAPRSVAVIGASLDPRSPGHRIAANAADGYQGQLAVVRPDGAPVAGVPGYRSVGEVPFPVDLAVVSVPAAVTLDVLHECGRAGVQATVVITAGFSEAGGGITDATLVEVAHRYGMRLLGPNCLGLTAPQVGLDATFASVRAPRGRVAFGSQSGGLGIAVLAEAALRGIGISSFVSLGNRADVSSNDLLCAWAEDDSTHVILLYLESIGNARRFLRIARHVSEAKPVVILKAGRTPAGRRGAASHTAALASDDAAVDALFDAAGVIRVTTLEELLDMAQLLDHQPAPAGRRMGLIGNSGGPLILAADTCETHGLVVPPLSAGVRDTLAALVPDAAATANPVDLLATVTVDRMADAVRVVADSGEVDAIAVCSVALGGRDGVLLHDAVTAAPVAVPVAVSVSGTPERSTGHPLFPHSESAVAALALAAGWHERRTRSVAEPPSDDDVDWVGVRRLVRAGAVDDAGWLAPEPLQDLSAALRLPVAPAALARSADEAVARAAEVGGAAGIVVMKAVVPGLVHKTEAGGVLVWVHGEDQVRGAYAQLAARFTGLEAVMVQRQAPVGPELLVGAHQDPVAGPLVVVAAGGIEAELLADRVIQVAPVSAEAARELLLSLRTAARLTGFRGRPPSDLDAAAAVVVTVARLAALVPEVAEFEINPLITSPTGAVGVDLRARVDLAGGEIGPLRGE